MRMEGDAKDRKSHESGVLRIGYKRVDFLVWFGHVVGGRAFSGL